MRTAWAVMLALRSGVRCGLEHVVVADQGSVLVDPQPVISRLQALAIGEVQRRERIEYELAGTALDRIESGDALGRAHEVSKEILADDPQRHECTLILLVRGGGMLACMDVFRNSRITAARVRAVLRHPVAVELP